MTVRRSIKMCVVAGTAAVVLGLAVGPGRAEATNLDTKETDYCGQDQRWTVTISVTNHHDAPLHVGYTTTHGPSPLVEIKPGATFSVTEYPDNGSDSFTWSWTSPDGHLKGATSGTAHRPAGCGVPETTTTTAEITIVTPPPLELPPVPTTVVNEQPPASDSPSEPEAPSSSVPSVRTGPPRTPTADTGTVTPPRLPDSL